MKYLAHFGTYCLMWRNIFVKFTKWRILRKLIIKEINDLIVGSFGIILTMSFFVGMVLTIQMALSIENPLLPDYIIGYAVKQSMILEFSPTLISIIMAGRIGSYITSSIGAMRVTEQIDALQVMGVNTFNYLIFPKIVAMSFYPLLVTISMFVGVLGGYFVSFYSTISSLPGFMQGLAHSFEISHVYYAFTKSFIFAMVLATVPSYHGYYLKGGALDVGKATTVSFIWSSVSIIILNYILTQLMLT